MWVGYNIHLPESDRIIRITYRLVCYALAMKPVFCHDIFVGGSGKTTEADNAHAATTQRHPSSSTFITCHHLRSDAHHPVIPERTHHTSTPLLWLGSNMHQSFSVCGTGNWTSCRQSTRACYRCKPSTSWFLCKTCNFSYQEINLEPFLGMSWHRQTVLKLRLKWMNKVCVHIHWAAADTSPLQVVK